MNLKISKFKKFFEKNVFLIFLFGIEICTLFLIIHFLRYNNLQIWDIFGHYFSATYVKEYLFPRPTGWNPFFFLGFPLNQFYGPLYSYLGAALGFVVGIELAFKLILITSLILMPVSFYYFARKFEFSKLKSSIIMLSMWAILFINPQQMGEHMPFGGDMYTTFNIGIITNAVALMLLFFYLGKINESFKNKKYIIPSILFSLIILMHPYVAVIAFICFLAIFITKTKIKKYFPFTIKHLILTFLLTAFWTIPFLAKISYTRSFQVPFNFSAQSSLILISIIIALIYLIYYKKQTNIVPIGILVAIFMIFILIANNILQLPIQFQRFSLFLYLLVPIIVVSLFKENRKIIFLIIIIVSIFIILFNIGSLHPEGSGNLPQFKEIPKVDGRILVIASPRDEPSPHVYQQLVPLESKNFAVKGLFIESAINNPLIMSLERELDNDSFAWGVVLNEPYIRTLNISDILPYQLNLFDINYIFSSSEPPIKSEKINEISFFETYNNNTSMNLSYSLYKVGNSSLIEVLNYTPRVIKEYWDVRVGKWFLTEDIKNGILVNEQVLNVTGTGNETVEILEMSKTQEYIKFRVNSTKDVPILIKISEFPNWKAYSNDEELKIYRASPYLMLIYGKGVIELKYENLFVDKLGMFLTFLGIIFLVYKGYKELREKYFK